LQGHHNLLLVSIKAVKPQENGDGNKAKQFNWRTQAELAQRSNKEPEGHVGFFSV
jgi:hypothetical protein